MASQGLTGWSRAGRRFAGRRADWLLLGALLASSAGATAITLAVFTDQESVTADLSAGSIMLDAAKVDGLVLTASGMLPGDTVTDDVVIENDGTAPLRYAMTTSSTDADGLGLRDALTLEVRTIDATTPGIPCDDFDGTLVSSGAIGPSTAGFGDPAAGPDGGDRELAAGASETLCFRVSLPLSADNGVQGATTTTTFTFDAEQVANNP